MKQQHDTQHIEQVWAYLSQRRQQVDEHLQDLHHVDLFPSYEEGLQRILRSMNVLE